MSVSILIGDCRERMKELPDASVDSVVCDPPYHLTNSNRRVPPPHIEGSPFSRHRMGVNGDTKAQRGFMGQEWDGGDVAFQPETWAEVLRVMKPGGHLVAFSGTRTYHRMVCAIEDAGFEIRDQLAWVFASGFPKSHNLDKALGDENRCLCGAETLSERDLRLVCDTDVSPAIAPSEMRGEILLPCLPEPSASTAGRTELSDHAGTGKPRMEGRRLPETPEGELQRGSLCPSAGMGEVDGEGGRLHHGASASDGADVRLPADALGSSEPQGSQPGEQSPVEPGAVADKCGSQARGSWPICGGCRKPIVPTGYGSALKPAYEPICLARKPLQGTILRNFLTHGTGALNIDGCRVGTDEIETRLASRENGGGQAFGQGGAGKSVPSGVLHVGRWPANLCHDGSDEVLAGFPETESGGGNKSGLKEQGVCYGKYGPPPPDIREVDSGSAARFFATFPIGEDEWQFAKNVHAARSAESPCGSCGTPIAGDPAGTLTLGSKSAGSQAGPASIGICERCIPSLSPALIAASLESTGTIPTIPSCSKSNGSATPAIVSITSQDDEAKAAAGNAQASATRFLYCPKATTEERGEGNNHPTVKPVALMRWLVRLVTPKGGTVLDPFLGSGSTGLAADAEQFDFIGCEMSPEYAAIAERRMRDAAGMFADVKVAA